MEPTAVSWDGTANDDALLREALAFIGDLDVDDGELSPPSIDGDAFACPADSPNSGFFSSLLAAPLAPQVAETVESLAQEGPVLTTPVAPAAPKEPSLAWPSTVPTATTTPTKPKGNRSRTKRREELLYLRDMVSELETQLTQLKRTNDEAQLQLQLERCVDGAAQARPSALVLAAWEQVATRQYEQRQRSEMENIKLKRLLEDQIQIGKSLERLLLRKRPKFEGMEMRPHAEKRPRVGSLATSWDNHQIFHELLASIDTQYAETARVLAKAQPLFESKIKHRNVELVRDEELGMVLRTTESNLLPFEYELAVQEFWVSMPSVGSDNISGDHDVNMTDDLIKSKFRARATFGRTSGDLTVYMADRRFREAGRTVFVSSAFFDPTEIEDMNMDGVYMRHRGWIVFEPVPMDPTSSSSQTKAATRMTSYLLAVPEVFDGLEDNTRKVGTLTNFVMSALSIELESRQQAFENRLFDRSCEVAASKA